MHILLNILGLSAYFSKPILALKPNQARCFEYHEPYKGNIFFSYKGAVNFKGGPGPALPGWLELQIFFFLSNIIIIKCNHKIFDTISYFDFMCIWEGLVLGKLSPPPSCEDRVPQYKNLKNLLIYGVFCFEENIFFRCVSTSINLKFPPSLTDT